MYNVEMINRFYRYNPWNNLFTDRLKVLKKAKKLNKKTVAFIYPKFDSSTFRYRGYNVSETLEYSFYWAGSYFEMNDIKGLELEIELIDVLVLIRCDWDDEIEEFIKLAKEKNIHVVYDVDDLIYDPKYMPTVIKTLGLNKYTEWNYWFGLTYRNYLVASMCDAFITTNGYLAEYLEKDFNKTCYIIKNYLNWTQEQVSKEYFLQKQEMESEEEFVIGYFSGSNTHVKDLMVAMPEIEKLLIKYDDIVLKIVGYMDLPRKYAYLVKRKRIQFVPFQTFVGLQYEQAKVDINIVPLVNNEFSNCKSELKYFETAIVGTITCATPTYTYKQAITNGDNGYLCKKGEWFEVLEKLYLEGVSSEAQKYIHEKALKEYGNKNQLAHVEKVLDNILGVYEELDMAENKKMEQMYKEQLESLIQDKKNMEQELYAAKELEEASYKKVNDARKINSNLLKNRNEIMNMSVFRFMKVKHLHKKHEKEILAKGIEYWAPVFDAKYYAEKYEDVRNALGTDDSVLLDHFLQYGVYEGRSGTEKFNVVRYMELNKDVAEYYFGDNKEACVHYIEMGQFENRSI